jgi:hypothetical protein
LIVRQFGGGKRSARHRRPISWTNSLNFGRNGRK